MAATLQLVLLIGLSIGLLMGVDAHCKKRGRCKEVCKGCPNGWIRDEERCYKLVPKKKEWCAAEKHCIAHGGNLVSIHDNRELNAVKDVIKNYPGKSILAWIGGTDAAKEGCYLWADGSQWEKVPSFWATGQPTKKNKQDCIMLAANGARDVKCDKEARFICSRDIGPRE